MSPLIDPRVCLLTEGRGQIENLLKKKHARKSHEGVYRKRRNGEGILGKGL
jgi:hypothetical protein